MKELFQIPKPLLEENFMNKPIEMSNNIDRNKQVILEENNSENKPSEIPGERKK